MARNPRTPRTPSHDWLPPEETVFAESCSGKPSAQSDALVALASDLRIAVVREVAANPASEVGIATGIS
jgi:hypothetical protein